MEPGGDKKKLAHLDGLRGLAAVVVVISHFANAFLPASVFGNAAKAHFALEKTIYSSPLQLLVAGNFAVCIFFALSGYVLSHKFFNTKDAFHARAGAAKRYFRLMPPILASILLSYAVYHLGLSNNVDAAKISGSTLWLSRLWPPASGLGFHSAIWQGVYGALTGTVDTTIFNNVLWTMKVEFFGSFLVYAFITLFGNARNRWVIYIVLIMLSWNTYYFAFILGLLLSDLTATRPKLQLSTATLTLAMVTGLTLGAAPIAGPYASFYSNLSVPFLPSADMFVLPHVVGAGLILMTVIYSPFLKHAFATRPMRYIGKISFSLYLLHVIILGSLACTVLVWLAPRHSYLFSILMAVLISIPATVVAAHYFTKYVDGPSVRLANRLGTKFFMPRI